MTPIHWLTLVCVGVTLVNLKLWYDIIRLEDIVKVLAVDAYQRIHGEVPDEE